MAAQSPKNMCLPYPTDEIISGTQIGYYQTRLFTEKVLRPKRSDQ